ncbi:MAG TPA: SBBP repeat-containing protein [Pirellulales bacterium]|nr:SBBP repeat-containing protein [Pirellulales bacterium]
MKPHRTRQRRSLTRSPAFLRASHLNRYRLRLDAELLETRSLLNGASSNGGPTLDAYSQNPLSFEPNVGQTAAQVQFLSQGSGYSLYLDSQEAVLALQKFSATAGQSGPSATPPATSPGAVVQMQLVGANPAAKGVGLDKLLAESNYIDGGTPNDWLTNIPNYAQVEYQNVYPGINLVYIGNQQQLEFNFEVAAGADASAIAMSFQGVDSLSLDSAGNLVLRTSGGNVTEDAPVAYQEIDGVKQIVAANFVLEGSNQVAFKLGHYDHSQPLVIDPVVVYSTYLGGSLFDNGNAIAVDSSGDAYVAGSTTSADIPTHNLAGYQSSYQNGASMNNAGYLVGDTTTFIAEYNPSGQLIHFTYLGGNATGTQGTAIASNLRQYFQRVAKIKRA